MGLSIHYSGRFKDEASLPEMIHEVKDIAKVHDWSYTVFETEFPEQTFGDDSYDDNIYGICIAPPKCEPVFLTFLSNRRMSGPTHLMHFGKSNKQEEQQYLYMLAIKTQYAGMETHKYIIQMFRYLNKKYLQDFSMTDEGKYWETGDEQLLKQIFDKYTDMIDTFSFALDNFEKHKNESLMDYLQRMFKKVHKKINKKD